MKFKKFFLIICILICLISFTSVTAININDNETTIDHQTDITNYTETNSKDIGQNYPSNVNYDFEEYDQKLGATDKTYNYLQVLVGESSTVDLQYDISYSPNSGNKEGIRVISDLVINGNGHYIDGKNSARAFHLGNYEGCDITFINITFKNCYNYENGGAIFIEGADLHLINCTFENNYARGPKGTDIFGTAYNFSLIGSKFTYNNTIRDSQGSINLKGINFFISDCDFYNSTLIGAGILINGRNILIQNCNFNSYGKAYQPITLSGVNATVSKCKFINNMGGGVCFQNLIKGFITDCYFANNYRNSVSFKDNSKEIVLFNSIFENNNDSDIIWDCKFGDIISCKFLKDDPSKIFSGNLSYCNLINNTGVGKSFKICIDKTNLYNKEVFRIFFEGAKLYEFYSKPVTIDIGKYHYEETTDKYGQILLDISNIKENGQYYSNIYFTGTSEEDACSLQTFLNINYKKETNLIIPNITSYQPEVMLEGELHSQNYSVSANNPYFRNYTLSHGKICIICDDKDYIVTNDGKISLNLNLKPGNYEIITYFEGDSLYSPCHLVSSITVLPSIFLNNLKMDYVNIVNFNINFLNKEGNILKYEYVLFNIDGIDNILITNENGIVNFNKQLTPGTHIIKIINPNTKEEITTKIIVKSSTTNSPVISQKTILTLKSIKVKKSAKKLVLQATLKEGNNPLKSKKIIFKFNGKKYTAKTNKKGIAKVTIKKKILKKLKVGKKVKYQVSYGKITVKKSVKVKK